MISVKNSITRSASLPELIRSDRLLEVTFELHGRARAVTFTVAHAQTETQSAINSSTFWTTLERAVEDVRKQLAVCCVDGCQRPHGEEGEGRGGEQG